jgi:CubicO group peptidase (beta-lactamase class C family)
MRRPRIPTGGKGLEDTWFGYGFALGDSRSEAIGGLPAGAASWSGSGNTYFFIDPARGMAALLMTNELASDTRAETLRKLLNRAALRLRR